MIAALLPLLGTVLDKVLPDEAGKAQAKAKMIELAQTGELRAMEEQTKVELARMEIIKTEAASSGLTSLWRPILMLTFGGLIVARWFGMAAPELSEAEYLKLWEIVELGLGGYVIGRSVEKVAPVIANAVRK